MWRSRAASPWRAGLLMCSSIVVMGLLGSAPAALAGASPPDGRHYELVSPPAGKNGADVMVESTRSRVADDGDAVVFSSLTAFGDALGTGVATDYMAVRSDAAQPGTNGWAAHALTPSQRALSVSGLLNSDPMYVGAFSADLSQGVFRAWSPLTVDPLVEATTNLYLRDNLRDAGAGAYQLITPCPVCAGTAPLPPLQTSRAPNYAGASGDFQHLVFDLRANLTNDAPAQPALCATRPTNRCAPRVYEWQPGGVRLASFVPAGTDTSCGGGGPACVAADSALAIIPGHTISNDGQRIFFLVPTDDVGDVQLDGADGRVYVRTAGTTTDELTASERTDCAGDLTCGRDNVADPAPVPYVPARFGGAMDDGRAAFFVTSRALTDDAPANGDRKLYMYDATKPASDPHNLTFLSVDRELSDPGDVELVLGSPRSDRYVYFVAAGQLVSGESTTIDRGIYMWHDGEVSYIGAMVLSDEGEKVSQTSVTPDGRRLLLSQHDGVHGQELDVYDAATHTLRCISCHGDGSPSTADALTSLRVNSSAANPTWNRYRAISDDGRRVFFTTAEALLSQDANGKADVYEYDVPNHELHLVTSGTDPSDSYFLDMSPNGDDAFIVTRERLVKWDVDTSYDLYDARVGGGFPDPLPPPARCSGPACQEGHSPSPGAAQVGTSAFEGAGDLVPKLRSHAAAKQCRKGFVKRRVRGKRKCVKRRHHHVKRARTQHERRAK